MRSPQLNVLFFVAPLKPRSWSRSCVVPEVLGLAFRAHLPCRRDDALLLLLVVVVLSVGRLLEDGVVQIAAVSMSFCAALSRDPAVDTASQHRTTLARSAFIDLIRSASFLYKQSLSNSKLR
jgi:hypothetical protein